MALVAVVERQGDRPGQLPETRIVPVGMPQDVEFESYFAASQHAKMMKRFSLLSEMMVFNIDRDSDEMASLSNFGKLGGIAKIEEEGASESAKATGNEDLLLELAARIEPDGGMPGSDEQQRILATMVTLLIFIVEGHTSKMGVFRSHVQRLIAYLQSEATKTLSHEQHDILTQVLKAISRDQVIAADWLSYADDLASKVHLSANVWEKIEQALNRSSIERGAT